MIEATGLNFPARMPAPAWRRPWPPRPAPGAARARRSCSRLDHLDHRARRHRGVGTSYIACCTLGSNFSPCGENFCTPFFSSALCSERSVSSTPSDQPLEPGASAVSRASAGTASSARCRLSAISSTSRAKRRCRRWRVRHLALGALAQVLHLGQRAQHPVLGLGGLLRQRLGRAGLRIVRHHVRLRHHRLPLGRAGVVARGRLLLLLVPVGIRHHSPFSEISRYTETCHAAYQGSGAENQVPLAADHLADDARGVVHHRDHPR